MNGVLFSCVKSTLDECRAARDEWTVTKYLRGEVENQDPLVVEWSKNTKEIIAQSNARLAEKFGLPHGQTKTAAKKESTESTQKSPNISPRRHDKGASR
jgi:hypothetical protein